MVGTHARIPSAGALDPYTLQDGDHLRAVAPLAGGNQQGQRPATALPGEVDLAGQAAPGTAESFVGAVLPR
ncbi:hypothetical protein GCM10027072_80330 [Streptomyces bullii]